MKKSIFSIGEEYLALAEQIEANEGELTEELEQALSINETELETKSIAYLQVIKTIEKTEIQAIDEEIKRLQAMKKSRKNLVERLKNNISNAMNLFEIEEIKTTLNKINFRKSKSVVISDIELLPTDCIIIEKKAISKTELKKRIEAGEIIPGAEIVENKNLQIK